MRLFALSLGTALLSAGSIGVAQEAPKNPAAPNIQIETPKVPADVKTPAAENPSPQADPQSREKRVEERRDAREERVDERQEARDERSGDRKDTREDRDEDRREARDGRTPENKWRYRFFNNHWWYWQPNNTWVIHHSNRWIPFDVKTYFTYFPRNGNPQRHETGYRGDKVNGDNDRGLGTPSNAGQTGAAIGSAVGRAVGEVIGD